jgi:hypothetical protein
MKRLHALQLQPIILNIRMMVVDATLKVLRNEETHSNTVERFYIYTGRTRFTTRLGSSKTGSYNEKS